ncbi:TetR family transcriptional regulator C-terminal domain-containing protein [Micromonosporaceae bacterium Da 78-11]
MTRIALQVWAEALRNPGLRGRADEALGRLSGHYAEVARRWQAAGHLPATAVPEQVGAAMLGLTQGFLLQRVLITGTTVDAYAAGVQALLPTGGGRDDER